MVVFWGKVVDIRNSRGFLQLSFVVTLFFYMAERKDN